MLPGNHSPEPRLVLGRSARGALLSFTATALLALAAQACAGKASSITGGASSSGSGGATGAGGAGGMATASSGGGAGTGGASATSGSSASTTGTGGAGSGAAATSTGSSSSSSSTSSSSSSTSSSSSAASSSSSSASSSSSSSSSTSSSSSSTSSSSSSTSSSSSSTSSSSSSSSSSSTSSSSSAASSSSSSGSSSGGDAGTCDLSGLLGSWTVSTYACGSGAATPLPAGFSFDITVSGNPSMPAGTFTQDNFGACTNSDTGTVSCDGTYMGLPAIEIQWTAPEQCTPANCLGTGCGTVGAPIFYTYQLGTAGGKKTLTTVTLPGTPLTTCTSLGLPNPITFVWVPSGG